MINDKLFHQDEFLRDGKIDGKNVYQLIKNQKSKELMKAQILL